MVKKNDILIIETKAFLNCRHKVKPKDGPLKKTLIYDHSGKNIAIVINAGYISREDLEYGLENLPEENNVFSNFTDIFQAIKYALPATQKY